MWTEERVEYLIENYKSKTCEEIGVTIGKSKGAVWQKASRLGLVSPFKWTEDLELKLVKYYDGGHPYKEIAKLLNVAEYRIKKKMAALLKGGVIEKRATRAFVGPIHKTSQEPKVYVVYFPSEGFYKVGVTSRLLLERFRGYPNYEVITELKCSKEKALRVEKFILSLVDKYEPKHRKFYRVNGGGSGGYTECFKTDNIEYLLNRI